MEADAVYHPHIVPEFLHRRSSHGVFIEDDKALPRSGDGYIELLELCAEKGVFGGFEVAVRADELGHGVFHGFEGLGSCSLAGVVFGWLNLCQNLPLFLNR